MTEQFARDQLALEIANKDAKKQEIAKKKDESAAKKLKKQEELEKKERIENTNTSSKNTKIGEA